MKKLMYSVCSVLLFVPFTIGLITGFFWRGLRAGHFTGFNWLQQATENDLVEAVNIQMEKELTQPAEPQTGVDIMNLFLQKGDEA